MNKDNATNNTNTILKIIESPEKRDVYTMGISAGFAIALLMHPNTYRDVNNAITYVRRFKSLNHDKNLFYFDGVVDDKYLKKFKDFMNNLNSDDTVYIYLQTNGGSFSAAQMICDILLNHKGETNSIISHGAFSAGTLIALSCKNIYMHQNAHLSPVDVIQCSYFDVTQLLSVGGIFEKKNHDKINDSTYILDDQATKCRTILTNLFDRIANNHEYDEKTKKTVFEEIFEGKKYVHSTSFSVEQLKSFGIDVQQFTPEMKNLSNLTYIQPEHTH